MKVLKMKKTFLMTRKINGEEYKFYHMDFTKEESFTDEPHGCFIVETPENAFGYSDVVYFDRGGDYTMHRYLAPYKIRKLRSILESKGYDPASKAYMEF